MRRSGRSPEQPLGHSEDLTTTLITDPEVSPVPRPIVRMLGVILVKHVCEILASLAADLTPIVRRMPLADNGQRLPSGRVVRDRPLGPTARADCTPTN